jgi:polyisoprenoid-binding protein YceI
MRRDPGQSMCYAAVMTHIIFPFIAMIFTAAAAHADPDRYALHPEGSTVRFTYRMADVPGSGTMPITRADIALDFDNAAASTAVVTLRPDGVSTGMILITEALKSADLLDTATYPDITFVSRSVQARTGGATMTGDVTVRGVTRPLTLDAQIFRPPDTAPGDRSRLTVRLRGQIDRNDFGASGYQGLVDGIVTLDITARLDRLD